MEKKLRIIIIDGRITRYLLGTFQAGVLVLGPILIGIFADSSAMQWAGFVFGFLTFVAWAVNSGSSTSLSSIEDARRQLDALEKAERKAGAA